MNLPEVAGLEEFWGWATGRTPPSSPLSQHERVMLDALGLGLEQTFSWLRQSHADLAAFQAWIVATAGVPDIAVLSRYHAVIADLPPPAVTADRLAAIATMPPVLGETELAEWERDGFVILRGAIKPDEADELARTLWHAVGACPDKPESWYGQADHGIMVQQFQHPLQQQIRRSPRIHKAFAQLWGHADLWTTTDRMSFNPPERPGHLFPGPHLHWDCSLAQPIPFGTQGIIYLEDTADDQGALQIVPGFHHHLDSWLAALDGADPRASDLGRPPRRIGAEAGDLVVWRQDLPHGASPNRASRPRLAQYLNMYPADYREQTEWR